MRILCCPTEQIDMWLHTWLNCSSEDCHDTGFSWYKDLSIILTTKQPLNSIGPVAAKINALTLAGWKLSRQDIWWVGEGGSITVDKKPFTRFQTIARAQADLQN